MPRSFGDFLLSSGAGQEGALYPGFLGARPGLVSNYLWAMELPAQAWLLSPPYGDSPTRMESEVSPAKCGGGSGLIAFLDLENESFPEFNKESAPVASAHHIPQPGVSTGVWPCHCPHPPSQQVLHQLHRTDRMRGDLQVEASVRAHVTGHSGLES